MKFQVGDILKVIVFKNATSSLYLVTEITKSSYYLCTLDLWTYEAVSYPYPHPYPHNFIDNNCILISDIFRGLTIPINSNKIILGE